MPDQIITPSGHVVLAIDGSEHAMAAVQLVQSLPLPENCKITVLTVLIPRNAQYHATLSDLLERTRTQFSSHPGEIETVLLTGYPGEQIIQYAKDKKADMIVLGAKGLRGTIRILLGGVAQQVVEYADCPVLLVRAPHSKINRVLLATDGSEHSRYAVKHLDLCPLPSDAAITILHVLPPEVTSEMLIRSWPYGFDSLPPVLSEEIEEGLKSRATEEEEYGKVLVKDVISDLDRINLKATPVIRRGDAAAEILKYSEENKINLIIAGSRGLNQIRSWLLGSVSSKLSHYAECSVLILKMPR